MRSRSKYELNEDQIRMLFQKAGIEGITDIGPLGDGEFNSVYSVDAGGQGYALKVAPLGTKNALTYEHGMMEQEVYYYGLMEAAGIHVPKVYHSDFSCTDIKTSYFIMERLQGHQLDKADLTDPEKQEADRELIEMVAKMHGTKGDGFGYRQMGLKESWYEAIAFMVETLIKDGQKISKNSKRGRKLLSYIHRHADVLKSVECCLINFDIWPPNIFVNKGENLSLSWIDPERCLWGDRVADLVCLDFMNMTLDSKQKVLDVYNQIADTPIQIEDSQRVRLAIMLGYLGLIMEIEKYVRYTPFHFGYWRNVTVSKMLFKSCFDQLEGLSK